MLVPSTLWPAPDADWRLPGDLIAALQAAIIEPMPTDFSKPQRHNLVQRRVAQLGGRLGYAAETEVGTGQIAKTRQGRFDVVWTHADDRRPIVFEIDSSWRMRSLVKLGGVPDSQLRLWIYYGQRAIPEASREPGLRKLNILQIDPALLGLPGSCKIDGLRPSHWPGMPQPDALRGELSSLGIPPGQDLASLDKARGHLRCNDCRAWSAPRPVGG